MATLEDLMHSAPLWVIGASFFALLALISLRGSAVRRATEKESRDDTASEGYLLSAVLALLGLLIAFTFSLSLTRYDARRTMVVEEGNAISTAWWRATLVDGPEGKAYQDAIRAYADIRLKLPDSSERAAVERDSARPETVVWARLKAALPLAGPPLGATMVNATTEMFDAAARRKAERDARIPGRVLDVVSLYALMSAGIIGYVLGRHQDRRHTIISLIFFLLLSLAMALILDLDRPWSGSITISQQPIADARAGMN